VTDRNRKQLLVLGVLVALFVTVIVVSRGEGPATGTSTPSNQRGTRGAATQAPPAVVDVNIEALKADHDGPSEPERNLFAFKPKPAPPPPPPPPPQRPVDIAPPVPIGPPPPPPIPLKFIGVLEIPSQGAKVAVLSDGRGGTYHAKEGDNVLGQYRLLKIGAESVEMSYIDGRGRQTLRLSGQ
jgi:hypothetical protein